jgi:excisionase family DNA binding protein
MDISDVGELALDIDGAAASSTIGRTMIFEKIKNGELKAHKCGRRTLILVDDLKAFLNALPVVGSGE